MIATQEDLSVRNELLIRMATARRESDSLFEIVHPDALYDRPIPERHRIIFYLGHLEAFDWNLLHGSLPVGKASNSEFDHLFAFGIDPVGGGLPTDQPSDWPSLKYVRDYASGVRASLDEQLPSAILGSSSHPRETASFDTLLNVAIEHRLMHLETLAYMLHQLPLDRKIGHAGPGATLAPAAQRMIEVPAGVAKLGLARDGETFGWDNEYEATEAFVPAFEIDQFMVTNQQYLDFMNAGGYETRSFWSDDHWNWKNAQSLSHPLFWRRAGEDWFYRTMFDERPLPVDWPVYVSHAEASAYARWAGKALPTEAEWHHAAYGSVDGYERSYPWGNQAPADNFGNFDFASWDPTSVGAHPDGESSFGVQGMLGNGWEWTSTVFSPFPGFKPFPFYRGYSADFFDGKHFVMKGGSARTARCMLRPTFRNWFQPHYPYVYAGFRCVKR